MCVNSKVEQLSVHNEGIHGKKKNWRIREGLEFQ